MKKTVTVELTTDEIAEIVADHIARAQLGVADGTRVRCTYELRKAIFSRDITCSFTVSVK